MDLPHWRDWDIELLYAHWGKAMYNPYHFLTTFCYTYDPHDSVNPIKLIPKKGYIREVCDVFLNEQLLLVPKSRKMLVTWIMCALGLWDTIRGKVRHGFIQSQREENADELVKRCEHMWRWLPEVLRPRSDGKYCKLVFSDLNSYIQGIPRGADIIRQFTASWLFSDETAFQEQAEEAFIAAKPTIAGGGKYIAVSTPNYHEHFYRMVHDKAGYVKAA